MVTIEEQIPKVIERVAIEEYYRLFCSIYGSKLFAKFANQKFTSDVSKLETKDWENNNLMLAIGAVVKSDDNVYYAIQKDEEGLPVAIGRFRLNSDGTTTVFDIIGLNYPTEDERKESMGAILAAIEDFVSIIDDRKDLFYEVSKIDLETLALAESLGWVVFEEESKEVRNQRTLLLIKKERIRTDEGFSRSRRQAKECN